MIIVVDGMGGDDAPYEIVKGCVQAAKTVSHKIIITGDEKLITSELKKYKYNASQIQVIHTSEVITNDDPPARAVRTKKNSSMVRGINLVKSKEADLFISAGSTGALMAGGLFILGRVPGIDRPALAMMYPIMDKHASLLVDAGANSECKSDNLLEFAIMGSIYMEKVMGIENPTVGLVNIGTEEGKGTSTLKEAYSMLKKSNLNFIGNIEAREVPNGICDVMVCDGFTGNIILKLTEGLAWTIFKTVKTKFTRDARSKVGALLLSDKLKELKGEFDYSEYGGAPILGVKGALIKIHGASTANAVSNAIIKGITYVANNVVDIIENSVIEMEEITISE